MLRTLCMHAHSAYATLSSSRSSRYHRAQHVLQTNAARHIPSQAGPLTFTLSHSKTQAHASNRGLCALRHRKNKTSLWMACRASRSNVYQCNYQCNYVQPAYLPRKTAPSPASTRFRLAQPGAIAMAAIAAGCSPSNV